MWLLRLFPLVLLSNLASCQFDDTAALVIGGSLGSGVGLGLASVELIGCGEPTTDLDGKEVNKGSRFTVEYFKET